MAIFAAAWVLGCAAFAAEPGRARPTFHPSIAAANEAAAADQSLVLVVFGADWCAPCRVMKKTVFAAEEFLSAAGALRIAEVDIDANSKAAADFNVSVVPTLVMLASDGKIILRQEGAQSSEDLLKWIATARERASRGQWEGTAPSTRISEFVTRAAGDNLTETDLVRLIEMLGDTDPAERSAAARIIAGQRERAVTPLISALTNGYLGIRIGASELLARLAPEAPLVDPWQPAGDLQTSADGFRKWWSGKGTLPAVVEARPRGIAAESSLKAALDALLSDDPVRRTDAMSLLVSHGEAALPDIRDAIKASDRSGDHRSASLLEDVRWAILVPDALEGRAKVRSTLARGTSLERQAAAGRLGRVGKDALTALGELASDSDPLVVESTVRALSAVGGSDAVPAMAALLTAGNPNLRVTAAQALGRSKDTNALPHLIRVVTDSNEVVATTAIAAIGEIYGGENDRFGSGSSDKEPTPPGLASALKPALKDPRWRIRSSAAELAGKLSINELLDDLRGLLKDSDAFVVRSALMSVKALGAEPDATELAATAQHVPAVRSEVLQVLAQSSDPEAVKAATTIYEAAQPGDRASILGALGVRNRYGGGGSLSDSWEPLLVKAAADTNAVVRRAAAAMLPKMSTNVAARSIGKLIADEDEQVQVHAAEAALGCLTGAKTISDDPEALLFEMEEFTSSTGKRVTNAPVMTPALRAEWKSALQKRSPHAQPLVAAVAYVLGDSRKDLPQLTAAIARLDRSAMPSFSKSPALPAILPLLPWPEGKTLVDALVQSPLTYGLAATHSLSATQAVRAYLIEPERFSKAVGGASEDDLAILMPLLLKRSSRQWTLLSEPEAGQAIAVAMASSTNAGWRAASVYILSQLGGSNKLSILARAAQDTNSWVRIAGIQGFGKAGADRQVLEKSVAPAIADPDLRVAHLAAFALLEPELRSAAVPSWSSISFYYGRVLLHDSRSYGRSSEDRPLVPLETSPSYLALASRRAETNNLGDAVPFVLLLAQHREFGPLAKLIERHPQPPTGKDSENANAIVTAIALSRDSRFVPYVRAMAENAGPDEWQLRSALRALRGMSGPEVRQLRLDINRRLRKTAD